MQAHEKCDICDGRIIRLAVIHKNQVQMLTVNKETKRTCVQCVECFQYVCFTCATFDCCSGTVPLCIRCSVSMNDETERFCHNCKISHRRVCKGWTCANSHCCRCSTQAPSCSSQSPSPFSSPSPSSSSSPSFSSSESSFLFANLRALEEEDFAVAAASAPSFARALTFSPSLPE